MNWTKKDVANSIRKEALTSRQLQENNYSDISTNMDTLCSEIESLARNSGEFEDQYKSLIRYYQSLAGQVIAA